MSETKKYQVVLLSIENEAFDMPNHAKSFMVESYSIEDAVRSADKYLCRTHVIGYENDFTDDGYNHNLTRCDVTFGDADTGQCLRYEIEEI